MDYRRIDHVGLTVGDIDRSVDFYASMFDLTVIGRGDGDADWIARGLGFAQVKLATAHLEGENIRLELIQYVQPPGRPDAPRNNDVGAAHICFPVLDIEEAYNDLTAKGARFIAPPSPPHMNGKGFRFAYLLDPDDIAVEILQHQRSS
ncbi:VOC family protein [Jiangella anatolica]|uniref:VOC domain-containing protein n=1 Tax=Jiangella anatolica TaxID=2670374 RepID=A0A2W2BAX4_9ACTN|nr:VOC family protein [Jiangella anatolica]PZF82400.1 hypothetical protein C1I92_16840 [Jiangella anatolica]